MVFAFVVSNVAELVHQINARVNQNRARMESINAYMRYRGLPATLQTRIRDYHSFSLSRQVPSVSSVSPRGSTLA